MSQSNQTGAKSLCAAVFIFAMFALFMSVFPADVETADLPEEDGYQYAITIEFGAMTFYYDYGRWNVGEMRYRADASSQNPASGTTPGYPGWYGFDGTANRISIQYSNENETDAPDQNRHLAVSLDYRLLTAEEGHVIDGVTMEFYSDAALTVPLSPSFTVPHTEPQNTDEKTVLYISLRGEPSENGEKYLSENFAPIGMLTIRIGEILD